MEQEMKTKTLWNMSMTVLLAFVLAACGEDGATGQHDHAAHQSANAKSKTVAADGMNVVFDLMRMEEHQKMMQAMDVTMEHAPGTAYVLSLTLKDSASGSIIRDADVSFAITSPGGSSDQAGQVMSGAGMHHHAADVKITGMGAYRFEARIRRGDRTATAVAEFQL
jgi:hypothetical protein